MGLYDDMSENSRSASYEKIQDDEEHHLVPPHPPPSPTLTYRPWPTREQLCHNKTANIFLFLQQATKDTTDKTAKEILVLN